MWWGLLYLCDPVKSRRDSCCDEIKMNMMWQTDRSSESLARCGFSEALEDIPKPQGLQLPRSSSIITVKQKHMSVCEPRVTQSSVKRFLTVEEYFETFLILKDLIKLTRVNLWKWSSNVSCSLSSGVLSRQQASLISSALLSFVLMEKSLCVMKSCVSCENTSTVSGFQFVNICVYFIHWGFWSDGFPSNKPMCDQIPDRTAGTQTFHSFHFTVSLA